MIKRPKVLSIGHSYVVASNRAIMRQVAQLGEFEIELAAPSFLHGSLRSLELESEADFRYDQKLNVIPLNVYFSKKIHIMYYCGLKKLITQNKYDLVHIWEEPYVLGGYQIARRCFQTQTPYFFRTAQSLNKKYPFPFSYFEKFVLQNSSGWNAGASLVYQNLLNRGYPPESGVIINLGTDKNIFYPDANDRESIRAELGVEGFVIGFSGRLVESKGLDVLMDALKILKKYTSEKWFFLVLGSGPYHDKILSWAQENNFSDRVVVRLASHDEMPRFMRAMDCLVAPSQTAKNWKEQFGRMITEAFATKVPVIGSTSGEIPFVIDKAGLVVEEKDSSGWAQAIAKLMNSESLCQEFQDEGYKRFLKNYDVSRVARQYADFYRQIIDSKQLDNI